MSMPGNNQPSVTPVARGVTLCETVVGYENGNVDLYGLFNAITPEEYPHVREEFCVFAQLVNGLGRVPFIIDIREAGSPRVIYTTVINHLTFATRTSLVRVVMTIRGCRFERPGLYLVELHCNNEWVSDTVLELRPPREDKTDGG
ncbi:MAG: hypothetical protein U0746_08825 [Gemmataceae bacterium]